MNDGMRRSVPGIQGRINTLLRPYATVFWVRIAFIAFALIFCVLLFFYVELPFEKGLADIRIAADTGTYFDVADAYRESAGQGIVLLSFGGNLIGPLITALIFKTPFNIMLFNGALFLIAVIACGKVRALNRPVLAILLLLNGTTLVSLVSLNKEIFALAATLLFARYIYTGRRSKVLLMLCLGIGMLARWEQSVITVFFLFLTREKSYFNKHRKTALAILISLITVAYPIALKIFLANIAFAVGRGGDDGTIAILNTLQANFLFPLVLIPKAIMSLTNRTFVLTYWFSGYWEQDFTDLANQLVIHWQALAVTVTLIAAYFTDRLKLSRPIPFFIALYVTITSANAFIQPRYQYPVYVLLCFDLALHRGIKLPPVLQKLSFRPRPPVFRIPSPSGTPKTARSLPESSPS